MKSGVTNGKEAVNMEIYDVFYFNGAVAMALFSIACLVFIMERIMNGIRSLVKDVCEELKKITDEC